MWAVFALLSAVFAALTGILAKLGMEGINSNLATAIRTVVVLVISSLRNNKEKQPPASLGLSSFREER